jgi:GntR family histidine utilization transcriptional repressor
MAASPSPTEPPRYRQVKDFIVERILAGDWPSGHRVPSERILTEDFHVSRMTVHRALRELTAEGWLTRAQGAGTFVAEQKPQLALLEIRNIRSEVLERGHSYASQVIALGPESAGREVAEALGLRTGQRCFRSVILHLENGVPVQLEDRHVNPAFAPDYLKQDFTQVTPYEYLTALGPLDAAEHVIEAVPPSPEARRWLKLGPREPCLLLTRRTWSNGLVVSRARLTHPGNRWRIAGRQDYAPGPQRAEPAQ